MSDGSETLNAKALETIQCTVCSATSFPPIYLCKNGHIACKKCQPKLTKCRICRLPGQPLERNIQLERIAGLLTVPCNDCKLTFCIKDIEKHQATCDHRFICRICSKCTGTAQEVKEHVSQEHPLSYFELPTNGRKIKSFILPEITHDYSQLTNVLFTFKNEVFWLFTHYRSDNSLLSQTAIVLNHDPLRAEQFVFSSELVSRDADIKYRTLHKASVLGPDDKKTEIVVFIPSRIVRASQKGLVDSIITMSLIGVDAKEEQKLQETSKLDHSEQAKTVQILFKKPCAQPT